MHESLVKYLAGLLDADGVLSFSFSGGKEGQYYVGLHLKLSSSEAVDKHGFLETLPELTGMGAVYRETKNAQCRSWSVTKRSDLEKILPRLIKHMVIKARHWQWMLDARREQRGVSLDSRSCEIMKEASKLSRIQNVGPIRPKKHPTWAWTAGYLDGDGHYSLKTKNNKGYRNVYVGATAHENDLIGIEMLQHAFGGRIYDHSGAPHVKRWRRNLGPRDASFALRFLPKVAKHSRLKRHAIDQIIHNHSQRLSAKRAEAQAIV